jgi:prephenate dehydrogenase
LKKGEKTAIIGVGLLGGSLALALKKNGDHPVGWNHRASSRKKAEKILPVAASPEAAVRNAGVVVLSAHSGSILPALERMLPWLEPGALVLDVSSVKGRLVRKAEKIPSLARHYVPCHPMTGKEKSGPDHAEAGLFRGKTVFITPLSRNPAALVRRASSFWKKVGGLPVVLPASAHDRAVALTSHLPHLLASAFMHLCGKDRTASKVFRKAVGPGFKDFTRIAAGNPDMWRDIVEMNAAEIRGFLRAYRKILDSMGRNLQQGRGPYWSAFFQKAKILREKIR